MTLAAALDRRYGATLIDGNIEADAMRKAWRGLGAGASPPSASP